MKECIDGTLGAALTVNHLLFSPSVQLSFFLYISLLLLPGTCESVSDHFFFLMKKKIDQQILDIFHSTTLLYLGF